MITFVLIAQATINVSLLCYPTSPSCIAFCDPEPTLISGIVNSEYKSKIHVYYNITCSHLSMREKLQRTFMKDHGLLLVGLFIK